MRYLTSLVVLLLSLGVALSEEEKAGTKPVLDRVTEDRLTKLEEGLSQVTEAQQQQTEIIAKIVQREIQKALAGVRPSQPVATTSTEDLAGIERRLTAIELRLLQIVTSDLGALRSAMDTSPQSREDLFRVTNGRLVVDNRMRTWMGIRVNGARWNFPPGKSSIQIRFGPVRVVLINGGESDDYGQKDWSREDSEHVLKISISNRRPYAY